MVDDVTPGRIEDAQGEFVRYAREGGWLPCQFVAPSVFFHQIRPDSPPTVVADAKAAGASCAACPLRRQCETLGATEANGVWGGVSRHNRANFHKVWRGEFPWPKAVL